MPDNSNESASTFTATSAIQYLTSKFNDGSINYKHMRASLVDMGLSFVVERFTESYDIASQRHGTNTVDRISPENCIHWLSRGDAEQLICVRYATYVKETQEAGYNLVCCLEGCDEICYGYGHNAWPLRDGKCCRECNQKVLAHRVQLMVNSNPELLVNDQN